MAKLSDAGSSSTMKATTPTSTRRMRTRGMAQTRDEQSTSPRREEYVTPYIGDDLVRRRMVEYCRLLRAVIFLVRDVDGDNKRAFKMADFLLVRAYNEMSHLTMPHERRLQKPPGYPEDPPWQQKEIAREEKEARERGVYDSMSDATDQDSAKPTRATNQASGKGTGKDKETASSETSASRKDSKGKRPIRDVDEEQSEDDGNGAQPHPAKKPKTKLLRELEIKGTAKLAGLPQNSPVMEYQDAKGKWYGWGGQQRPEWAVDERIMTSMKKGRAASKSGLSGAKKPRAGSKSAFKAEPPRKKKKVA